MNGHELLTDEAWIEGWEGEYKISEDGTVTSIARVIRRVDGRRHLVCGGELKQQLNSDGYLRADLWRNGYRKRQLVHRLVAKAFVDHANGERFVDHIDGDRTNNHADNLEWVGYSINNQRAAERRKERN